ncbi:hypothetical protein [Microbacterium terricola]|uniref:Tfp pilus assembly protein PilO n=1 Tax=Microbacterium terricola TaxID=344163 RepID=A0ABM8DXG6_9MICO|nr:hypothetical protein [Microbacterium terricola]UYK38942.1 hypothetical protein OAU46_09500 [Microbacterium terricola]BDV30358.1 hypothetical protein Microterr_10180 [Microbacterium terricola]
MNLPKQFINLLGAVLTAAIVIAGIALIALPLYGNAQTTLASAKTVAQSNDVYQIQVDQLNAAAENSEQIDDHVAELRTEITALAKLDDVHELIADAAEETDARIVSTVAGESVAWVPRTSIDLEGVAAAAQAPADAEATTDEGEAPAEGETTTTTEETPAAPEDVDSPQQQVPISINVEVADAEVAADFLEALGAGPRLIGIEKATLTGSTGALTLSVSALAFIRTEDAS